jgi:hypothetical protein
MRAIGSRLAVVLGTLALVAAASCATSNAPPDPFKACQESCGGCCTPAGDCVGFPSQDKVTCGSQGQACIACGLGNTCSNGACVPFNPPPDSGSPDAGPPDAGQLCGNAGEACCRGGGCYLPLTCSAGNICVSSAPDAGPPDAGSDAGTKGDIGAACSTGANCKSGTCGPSNQFPGGYCTQSCAGGCPAGSTCGTIVGGSTNYCLETCSPAGSLPAGTRGGYVCEQHGTNSGGQGVFVPACTGSQTAQCGTSTCDTRGFCSGQDGFACTNGTTCGSGLSCQNGYCTSNSSTLPTGSACQSSADCTGGICIPSTDAGVSNCPPPQTGGGATTCWPSGYCSQDCTTNGAMDNSKCAAGSGCANFGNINDCVQVCAYDGGSGGCRSGYVCDRFTVTSTGEASCTTACNDDAYCQSFGATSCANGFCCGAQLFRCCPGSVCGSGLTCGSDGYCH